MLILRSPLDIPGVAASRQRDMVLNPGERRLTAEVEKLSRQVV